MASHDQGKAAKDPKSEGADKPHDEAQPAGVRKVEAMIARGLGAPDIAQVLAENPADRDAILTLLHQTRGNAFVEQVLFFGPGGGGKNPAPGTKNTAPLQPKLQKDPTPDTTDPLVGGKDMLAYVVTVEGQSVQVYSSPGGINHKPDVFMFFHGQRANLMIDPKMIETPSKDDNVSGNDSAGAAVAQAKATNTIVLLPQGNRGGGDDAGGHMAGMSAAKFPQFLDAALEQIRAHVGMKEGTTIKPTHIALAGHSAGGYMGVHEALSTAGKYSDTITDLTLMDTSYSDKHFSDALSWLFQGQPNKTIRIAQSNDQLARSHNLVKDPTPDNPKHMKDVPGTAHWVKFFGEAALKDAAKAHKMTLNQLVKFDWKNNKDAAMDRGNSTHVLQHTQVIAPDGKVQCDILVMESDLGHHEIRDNVMDDSINSIGKGPAGADDFGKNQIANYGRDPNAPHAGNAEKGEGRPPEPAKPPKK